MGSAICVRATARSWSAMRSSKRRWFGRVAYFETHSYRPIVKDYFQSGARWAAAPKPQLTDEPFDAEFRVPENGEPISCILTEFGTGFRR